ncbi:hypothetical protein QOZ80_8BG0666710 [Eleusine coracana subsp. coracana]|nr:hypothetical protein QOZ80_8BG0666710 [Eleusine coracana subsp. coracana]
MGVLGDGSGWCFCSGGAKLERIKSSLLAAKGAAVAAVSFPNGGGGKGGSGFLIHRALLLTTHGTIPSTSAASAAEVRLSRGRLLARLVPRRFFITSPILDITIVGLDVVDDESSSHGQQTYSLKTCLNPTLDLGSTVLILGHKRRDLIVGEGKVVIGTDNLIKFSTDEMLWHPGSAGFDMHGNLAFMVCDPMKLASSTPTGYASASSTALLASKKDVPAQFGIPIPAVCEWLKQHWNGSLEDVSKPTMTPARLTSSGERSGRSSLGNLHYIKTTEREGGEVLSSSQIPTRPAWQHGSCSSASAKISYGGKDSIDSHSFRGQHELTSKMYKPKNEQAASLMDINFPPEHPKSIRLPLPLKQMMPDEDKIETKKSGPHESHPSNVRINCDALHNVAYQENCWSEKITTPITPGSKDQCVGSDFRIRLLVVPSPTSVSSPSHRRRQRESSRESTDRASPLRPSGDPRDPRAIDPSAAMRQQRGVGMGRRREDPGLLTRAVDKVFRFVRFAEFEIFFVLFFIIAFILFKNLMSQPQYNQMFVKKPDLDDAWP